MPGQSSRPLRPRGAPDKDAAMNSISPQDLERGQAVNWRIRGLCKLYGTLTHHRRLRGECAEFAVTAIVDCALHDAGGREALLHGLNLLGSSGWRVVAEQRLSGSHGAEAAIDELGCTRQALRQSQIEDGGAFLWGKDKVARRILRRHHLETGKVVDAAVGVNAAMIARCNDEVAHVLGLAETCRVAQVAERAAAGKQAFAELPVKRADLLTEI